MLILYKNALRNDRRRQRNLQAVYLYQSCCDAGSEGKDGFREARTFSEGNFIAQIPENISFDQAASIPLCLNTAAVGLYAPQGQPGGAGLTPPWEPLGKGKYAGQPILVVGGSSTVGQHGTSLPRVMTSILYTL